MDSQDGAAVAVSTRGEAAHPPADRNGGTTDVDALVRIALERGDVAVDTIERLVALRERVEDRAAREAFVGAMSEFQAECPPISKNRTARVKTKTGGSYSYGYATLAEIAETVRPILAGLGLSYTWDSVVEEGTIRVTCTLRHAHGHSETATFTAPTDAATSAMSKQQEVAAALTYGRRQSLVQVLGLTTADDDTDGRTTPPKTISEKQAAEISALIEHVGADRERFLQWIGVGAVDDIPAARHREAVQALERKRGQG